MRLLVFIISITIFFSCKGITPQGEKPLDFSEITLELEGTTLNKPVKYLNKNYKNEDIDVTIFVHQNKNKLTELDIHFRNIEKPIYSELRDYYNTTFDTSHSDTIFNTWQTDSTEFILYKNSDSSILVNIFKRK